MPEINPTNKIKNDYVDHIQSTPIINGKGLNGRSVKNESIHSIGIHKLTEFSNQTIPKNLNFSEEITSDLILDKSLQNKSVSKINDKIVIINDVKSKLFLNKLFGDIEKNDRSLDKYLEVSVRNQTLTMDKINNPENNEIIDLSLEEREEIVKSARITFVDEETGTVYRSAETEEEAAAINNTPNHRAIILDDNQKTILQNRTKKIIDDYIARIQSQKREKTEKYDDVDVSTPAPKADYSPPIATIQQREESIFADQEFGPPLNVVFENLLRAKVALEMADERRTEKKEEQAERIKDRELQRDIQRNEINAEEMQKEITP